MWDVDNQTRYAHAHSWDRDREGAETWIVVVKGTFDIRADGSTQVAAEQIPVCELPKYYGEPGQSSLRLDTDLLRIKPTTDIIVVGRAHAPHDRPVEQLDVTLKTASFEKILRVFGDRLFKRGIVGVKPGAPRPFVTMPLVYERAFGGADRSAADPSRHDWDEDNPVGVGFATDSSLLVDRPVPNIEYPQGAACGAPAGFGPIAPHWRPRHQWAGTYDTAWERQRKPLLPDDLDDRFFLSAPHDQQPRAHLSGGEVIELRHMTPEGVLRFTLPRVVLGFETAFGGSEPIAHRQVLHSVIVEPDFARVCMVWQTSLRCHAKVLKLDHTRVTEKVLINAKH